MAGKDGWRDLVSAYNRKNQAVTPEPSRTKSGRVLNDEDLDALVAEVERGYDVKQT
jgi:hypothetical protein